MSAQIFVTAQPLDAAAFQPYGEIFAPLPGEPADALGDGWQCWYPLGTLDGQIAWQVGLVRSEARRRTIVEMERHLERPEWVFALDQALIQGVALSHPSTPSQPDIASFKAFILQPGQGVLIQKGVWHAVGLPAAEESLFYGFALAKETPDAQENSGWVAFAGDQRIRIV